MKKILSISLWTLSLAMIFASCEKDDMPGPDAQVYGVIRDNLTGEPVETDLINGSAIEAFELGYATPVSQRWVIKNTGDYRNDLVFSNNYNFELRNGNFFPVSLADYAVKPGENAIDFKVTPYIRIKDASITLDKENNKVMATFSLEPGDAQAKLAAVRLYAFSDMYVGEPIKFTTTGAGFSSTFNPAAEVTDSTFTLSIDLAANAKLFPAGRDYFFRVGALANVAGVGTVRHNYAPVVKLSL